MSTDTFYPVQKRLNGQSVGEFYIVDLEQTVDDYNTITIQLWNGATSQDLYNLALIEIVKRKNQYLYEVEIVTKKFIKAGEKGVGQVCRMAVGYDASKMESIELAHWLPRHPLRRTAAPCASGTRNPSMRCRVRSRNPALRHRWPAIC